MKNLLIICSFLSFVYPDSPITSTIFYDNYLDVEIIRDASENNILTHEGCIYLSNDKIPMENKLALINAISWTFPKEGGNHLDNSKLYTNFLNEKYGTKFSLDTELPYSNSELLSLAYLISMGDYFNMEIPNKILVQVHGDIKNTISFNIIRTLVSCQVLLNDMDKWCQIWNDYDAVISNMNFVMDMKKKSIDDITSYIIAYKHNCKN